jgi:hypothetical protein
LSLVLWSATSRADDGDGWELFATREGIQMFRKSIPGSPYIAFRGKGLVDAPLIQVATILLDDDRAAEWVDSLKESRVVRVINPSEYVELNYIKMPPLISDRDFVSDVKMVVDPDTRTFSMLYKSIDDPAMPPGKCVRGVVINSAVIMTSVENGTKTFVTAELHADLKGSLPAFLVNWVQSDWPLATFRGMRKQAAKTDIKRPAVFADVLGRVAQIVPPVTPAAAR